MSNYTAEGRLGNPSMELYQDPRIDPRLLKYIEPFGLHRQPPDAGVDQNSPLEHIRALVGEFDTNMQGMYNMIQSNLPGDENEPKVDESTETIKGVDGNDIKLHIFRKAGTEKETLPCVVYTHGGGMTIIETYNPLHVRILKSLAIAGVVAIAVDFRNAYTKEGHNPFPAGLNDCAAGVKWVADHKSELGISKVIVEGESGGGNLALATTLKAKREGWVDSIAGTYAIIPYISNLWGASKERLEKELPSAVAHDGYFLALKLMAAMGHYYTPGHDERNPLAWPYHATEEDVKGLPPHHIQMDELDPLRDEGKAYYRKLAAAGVPVAAQVNLGTTHGAGLLFRQALPEHYQATIDSIVAFAKRV